MHQHFQGFQNALGKQGNPGGFRYEKSEEGIRFGEQLQRRSRGMHQHFQGSQNALGKQGNPGGFRYYGKSEKGFGFGNGFNTVEECTSISWGSQNALGNKETLAGSATKRVRKGFGFGNGHNAVEECTSISRGSQNALEKQETLAGSATGSVRRDSDLGTATTP